MSYYTTTPAGTGSNGVRPLPTHPAPLDTPPDQAHPDVPTIVHNLIRDMMALEGVLHRWSRAQATAEDVSDCYVQFGVEFNAVVHAFQGYEIPTDDLHAIPTQLRAALEECLGETPSPGTLDRYLPEIRRLLSEVLQGLRTKQPAWRSAVGRSPTTASNRLYSPGVPRFPPGPFP